MNKSFTLIEILVVIVVIGVLSAFILVGMSSITSSANIAKSQAFANSLNNALLLGRVSQWKFDGPNNSGDATAAEVKDSWGANDGIVTGHAPTIVSSGCPSGNCLSFNGIDDYVNAGNGASLDITSAITIGAWIKTTASTNGVIVGKNYLSSYYINTASGNISFWTNGSSLAISVGANDGNWHHAVVWFNGTTKKIYFDGTERVSGAGTLASDTDNLQIGYSAGYYFNGLIDDVRIYNQAITASEIQQNYFVGLNSLLANNGISEREYVAKISELRNNMGKGY